MQVRKKKKKDNICSNSNSLSKERKEYSARLTKR